MKVKFNTALAPDPTGCICKKKVKKNTTKQDKKRDNLFTKIIFILIPAGYRLVTSVKFYLCNHIQLVQKKGFGFFQTNLLKNKIWIIEGCNLKRRKIPKPI